MKGGERTARKQLNDLVNVEKRRTHGCEKREGDDIPNDMGQWDIWTSTETKTLV